MFGNYYLKDINTEVYDIETTGLFAARDMIINCGFCSPEGKVWQNFAEDPADEKRVVEEAVERLSQTDAVISYNGDSFDLPYTLKRAQKYGICQKLPLIWSIDLFKWLKKYWAAAKSMEHLNQKSVEKALGLENRRDDRIPGGDCIPLYNHYLQTKDPSAKELILLHNADDVKQLARIAYKCRFLPYHEIAAKEGFLIKAGNKKVLTRDFSIKKDRLCGSAAAEAGALPISVYDDKYKLEYDSFTGKISLEYYLKEREGMLFTDLTCLPVKEEAFKELPSCHSGYLVLMEGGEPDYRSINILNKELLSSFFAY